MASHTNLNGTASQPVADGRRCSPTSYRTPTAESGRRLFTKVRRHCSLAFGKSLSKVRFKGYEFCSDADSVIDNGTLSPGQVSALRVNIFCVFPGCYNRLRVVLVLLRPPDQLAKVEGGNMCVDLILRVTSGSHLPVLYTL